MPLGGAVTVAGSLTAAIGLALALHAQRRRAGDRLAGHGQAMTPWFGREQRGRMMGIWSTCYQVGGLAAGALAAALLKRVDWRAASRCPPPGSRSWAGSCCWRSPRPRGRPRGRRQAQRAAQLVPDPVLWSLGLVLLLPEAHPLHLLFWLPFYLERSLGYARG